MFGKRIHQDMFLSHSYLIILNVTIILETDLTILNSLINKDAHVNDRHFIVRQLFKDVY